MKKLFWIMGAVALATACSKGSPTAPEVLEQQAPALEVSSGPVRAQSALTGDIRGDVAALTFVIEGAAPGRTFFLRVFGPEPTYSETISSPAFSGLDNVGNGTYILAGPACGSVQADIFDGAGGILRYKLFSSTIQCPTPPKRKPACQADGITTSYTSQDLGRSVVFTFFVSSDKPVIGEWHLANGNVIPNPYTVYKLETEQTVSVFFGPGTCHELVLTVPPFKEQACKQRHVWTVTSVAPPDNSPYRVVVSRTTTPATSTVAAFTLRRGESGSFVDDTDSSLWVFYDLGDNRFDISNGGGPTRAGACPALPTWVNDATLTVRCECLTDN